MKIRLRQEPGLHNKKPRSASAEKRKKIKKRRDHWLHLFQCKMGCEKCGYNENGYALIFAHRNPLEKHSALYSDGFGGTGMNTLVKRMYTKRTEKFKIKNRIYIHELFQEIRKCKILCGNCHMIETIEEGESERCWETHSLRGKPSKEGRSQKFQVALRKQTNLNQFFE